MIIKINGKDYQFNMSGWWGPQYKFEEIMQVGEHPERRFNPLLTLHLHVMFYCILLCDNEALDLTLEEFLAVLEDLTLNKELTEFYTKRVEILTKGMEMKEPEKNTKKKPSPRTRSTNG